MMKKAKKIKTIGTILLSGSLLLANSISAYAYEKEETVYVKLNADGSEKTTIVSEHLKSEQEQTIHDVSNLSDIFNVNGEEPFTQKADQITWENKGKDIYYQGKTEKQLPITLKINYRLNGKEQTADQMLGKSGKVEIRIEYENHETMMVNQSELPVPFVVTSTTMLPTSKNNNVSVTNGKVISNGSNYIVAALAAPGLDQALDLQGTTFNEIIISYETDSFELNSIYSIATPSLLSEADLDLFNRMDQGFSMMDEFSASYAKIRSGGQTLSEGTEELSKNYQLFHAGVSQLDSKSNEFLTGIETFNAGINTLFGYMNELNDGLADVSENSEALRQGAKQILDSTLQSCNQQLSGLLAQLNQADPRVPAVITLENYEQVFTSILTNYAQLPQVAPYVDQLQMTKASLDSLVQYYQGVVSYTQGVDLIADNSNQLNQSTKALSEGGEELKQGCLKLLAGTGELTKQSSRIQGATSQLSDGSKELYAGLVQFDEKGIAKISSIINGDIKNNLETIKNLKTAADQYKTFTDIADGVKGSTKFIMIVESKKK